MAKYDLTVYQKSAGMSTFSIYERRKGLTENQLGHVLGEFCWARWGQALQQPPSNNTLDDIKYFFKHMKHRYKYVVITRPGAGKIEAPPVEPDNIDLTPGEILVLSQAVSIGIEAPATLAFKLKERHNVDVPKEEVRSILARIHEELAK